MIAWLRRMLFGPEPPKPSLDPMADGMRDAYLARLARERAVDDALNRVLSGKDNA